MGAEALVPPDWEKSLPKKTGILSPLAATSGMLFEDISFS